MDVHPPDEPIRTVKDFFLHLLTITIGLLIALGLEGIVEWRHHERLVHEANTTMHEEVRYNLALMRKEVERVRQERREIDADLTALQKIQLRPNDPTVQNPALTANFRFTALRETAWKTAQSTGALGYTPYEEAQRYADLYRIQESFLEAQHEIVADQADLLGLVAKFDLSDAKKITVEQANDLAQRYGEWRAHLLYLDVLARLNAASYEAFLSNKPTPSEMYEDVK